MPEVKFISPKEGGGMARKLVARVMCVQGLYQMLVQGEKLPNDMDAYIADIKLAFRDDDERLVEAFSTDRANKKLLEALLQGCEKHHAALNEMIAPHLQKMHTLQTMPPLVRAILHPACLELAVLKDVPAKAVIDQYTTIAYGFVTDEEAQFVNALIDAVAKRVRAGEFTLSQ